MTKKDARQPGTPATVAPDKGRYPVHRPTSTSTIGCCVPTGSRLLTPSAWHPRRFQLNALATVDDATVVAVVPVDRSLDLKALAQARNGRKAAWPTPRMPSG